MGGRRGGLLAIDLSGAGLKWHTIFPGLFTDACTPPRTQAVVFELDRVIDGNPGLAKRLRRTAAARQRILGERTLLALNDRTLSSDPKEDLRKNSNRLQLSESAKRALADVAAHSHRVRDGVSDVRGNPHAAALYMKLCDRFEGMRVSPATLRGTDAQTAESTVASLRKVADAFNQRVTADEPEGARADADREATAVIEAASNIACCTGRLHLFAMSQAALNTLEDPGSLNLLRRGFLLRSFISALFLTNAWFQHSYMSVFTRFDPWSPRTLRITHLVGSLWASLFINSFFYAFAAGTPGRPLGPLTFYETLTLSLSE